jgi:hypothetical protein
MEFASSMGMNVYQLNNDQRIGATIHVWWYLNPFKFNSFYELFYNMN